MGVLEKKFSRMRWPPLVKSVKQIKEYPGYEYEFFQSFEELNQYFTQECGEDWRNQSWCEFWLGQHEQTKHQDRIEKDPYLYKGKKNRGPRRDIKEITALALQILSEYPKLSSYKLVGLLKQRHDVTITQKTAWRIIKDFKE